MLLRKETIIKTSPFFLITSPKSENYVSCGNCESCVSYVSYANCGNYVSYDLLTNGSQHQLALVPTVGFSVAQFGYRYWLL
jgi:hypothetical protein